MYIAFGVLGCGIALTMAGLSFKNYSNLFLMDFLKNFLISCSADIFVARFVGFLLISFPFSFSSKFLAFIETERLK